MVDKEIEKGNEVDTTVLSNMEGKESKEEENIEKREEKSEVEEGDINEWKTISLEKVGRNPSSQNLKYGQVTIATPSRYAALSNMDENGEDTEEEVGEMEERRTEEDEDIYQSLAEESVEENKKGRARQFLPRLSKTNHRVIPEASDNNKDMRRGGTQKHR